MFTPKAIGSFDINFWYSISSDFIDPQFYYKLPTLIPLSKSMFRVWRCWPPRLLSVIKNTAESRAFWEIILEHAVWWDAKFYHIKK